MCARDPGSAYSGLRNPGTRLSVFVSLDAREHTKPVASLDEREHVRRYAAFGCTGSRQAPCLPRRTGARQEGTAPPAPHVLRMVPVLGVHARGHAAGAWGVVVFQAIQMQFASSEVQSAWLILRFLSISWVVLQELVGTSLASSRKPVKSHSKSAPRKINILSESGSRMA